MIRIITHIGTVPNEPGDSPRVERVEILISSETDGDFTELQDKAAELVLGAIREAAKFFGEHFAKETSFEILKGKPPVNVGSDPTFAPGEIPPPKEAP